MQLSYERLKITNALLLLALMSYGASARELHVSVHGNDQHDGSRSKPYRTISAAAQVAQPGDAITMHEGTYRERVTPPRGGESDSKRIVYRAATGEKVVIKGSEVVRDWKPFITGVWKVTLPNSFFGSYNPYQDLIAGDWFADKGRPHHTGEVYCGWTGWPREPGSRATFATTELAPMPRSQTH